MKSPKLTKEKLTEYVNNPMAFRLEQWVLGSSELLPQGGPFGLVCQEWQKTHIFDPIDEKTSSGFPKYRLLYLQLPKKFSKTTLLAGECLNRLLLSPFPNSECYVCAGDIDQSRYLFSFVVDFIKSNPHLDKIFSIYKNEIVIEKTGAKLVALNSEASTKQGRNPDFCIFDEMYNQKNRDLWDSLWLGLRAKRHGQIVILTNPGPGKEGICWEIRNLCKSGEFKQFYYFEPVGEELKKLTVPWIGKDWLEMEKKTLPQNVYRRFNENIWVEGGDQAFMEPNCWNCFKEGLQEKISCNEGQHIIGIDFGLKKDAAAAVVLHRIGNKIHVDRIQRWQGTKKIPVQIAIIEAFISECIMNFFDVSIIADPWQMQGTLQKFQNAGVIAEEFHYTEANLVKLSQNLFFLFKNEALEIPLHEKLEEELRNLQIIIKTYGYRIQHSSNSQDDITMALGMATLVIMERGIQDQGNIDKTLRFLNKGSIFKSGEKRESIKNLNAANEIVKIIQSGKRIF